MTQDRYLTVDEAAEMLRVKKQTIYKWICEGKIPSFALGGRTLFSLQELQEWMEAHRRRVV